MALQFLTPRLLGPSALINWNFVSKVKFSGNASLGLLAGLQMFRAHRGSRKEHLGKVVCWVFFTGEDTETPGTTEVSACP